MMFEGGDWGGWTPTGSLVKQSLRSKVAKLGEVPVQIMDSL